MTRERLALHGGPPVRAQPFPAWPEWGEGERRALGRVLESGSWGGHPSPNVEAAAFNAEFARYVGARFSVACANGSVALQLALQAARVRPGAEVVTTVYSFVATASAVIAAGCIPVFVDVLPETYCLDPEQVEAAVGPRTEAVLPVHLAGAMADMDRLPALCERHGLLLVEDCAHAHGARWRGRCAGTLGALGGFSMQSTKLLTAGEGGAVTTGDPVLAQRLLSLVDCGRKEPGRDGFPERLLGHNLRMTEWQAAVLREQLRRLPGQHARRSERIALFASGIAGQEGLSLLPRDPRVTHPTAYQVIVRWDADAFAGVPRDHAVAALRAEGVPCAGRFYVPLPDDPLLATDPLTNAAVRAGADLARGRFPVAARAAYEEAVWLPHELFLGSEADVHDLVSAFAKLRACADDLRAAPPAAGAGAGRR
jgi:L-glutamine:scyllo-inosose aminotransferase